MSDEVTYDWCRIIRSLGQQTLVARSLGVSKQAVHDALTRGAVPSAWHEALLRMCVVASVDPKRPKLRLPVKPRRQYQDADAAAGALVEGGAIKVDWLAFCVQYRLRHWRNAPEALRATGWAAPSPHAMINEAASLLKRNYVRAQIARMQREDAEAGKITLEEIAADLDHELQRARDVGDIASAVRVIENKGRMIGAFTDKVEHTHTFRMSDEEIAQRLCVKLMLALEPYGVPREVIMGVLLGPSAPLIEHKPLEAA